MTAWRIEVLPSLPLGAYLRSPLPRLPYPFGEPGCRLYARARHGLWHGVATLGLRAGDAVLAPAYHHGSEIEALARAGLSCRFYEATETLEPDPGELESLVDPSVRALYLVHYLGFPQDAGRWRAWCDERGLALIEDAAQSWLAASGGRPAGSFGDLSIFCLYKTFGVPEGAAAVAVRPLPPAPARREPGIQSLVRSHGRRLVGRSVRLWRAYDPEKDFDLGDVGRPPPTTSFWLLERIADERAAERRRENYRFLLDELGEQAPAPFGEVPETGSPFGFPVDCDDKASLLGRLRAGGVRGLDFWSTPHPTLPFSRFPGARARRERTVVLPVHQELGPDALDRVVAAARRGPRRGSELRLEHLEEPESARKEWDELALRSRNVFATFEFLTLWWCHFGAGRHRIAAARDASGRIAAILPLYLWHRRPLRIARFLGHGVGDELGPVCAPADRPAVARALRRALREARIDALLAEQTPGEARWADLLDARVLSREGSPILRLDDLTWADVLAGRSSNLRSQLGRFERRLEREHRLSYRLSGRESLSRDLDALYALHRARWGSAATSFGRSEAFHREFAALALERGWLRLWLLELDGEVRAAWLGFRFAGAEWYYQAGRDPAFERERLGLVLLARTIRAATEDGAKEYRFLRGDEEYKYRFTDEDPGLETIGVAASARGAVALHAAPALRGARRAVRALER